MDNTLDTIDVAKIIASIFVFTMHCGAFSDYNRLRLLQELGTRWGVPFFFICSSYFLFKKDNSETTFNNIRKYVYRVGALYCYWFIINLPHIFYERILNERWSMIETWFVFLKNSVLSSTFIGSWYLTSSIFSAIFIFGLGKKLKTKHIILINAILYIICVFSSSYYSILPLRIANLCHFLDFPFNILSGCFYFALGRLVAERKSLICKVFTRQRAFVLFLLFYLIYVLEIYFTMRLNLLRITDVAFSTAVLSFFLFLFCLQGNLHIKNAKVLRKLSTIIYCAQGNIILVNKLLFTGYLRLSSFYAFLMSSALMIVMCIFVLYLQKKRWKWTYHLT